jgi:hypothetical protein
MQNTSNEDFGALLPSKKWGGWRRVSAASHHNTVWTNADLTASQTLPIAHRRLALSQVDHNNDQPAGRGGICT